MASSKFGSLVDSWIRFFCIYATLRAVTGYNMRLDQTQCEIGHVNSSNTVPRGGFEVDFIHMLEEELTDKFAENCISECCRVGSAGCQYVWIVLKYCYAVSCHPGSNTCQPVDLPDSAAFDSIYFRVTRKEHLIDKESSDDLDKESSESSDDLDKEISDGTGGGDLSTDLAPVANAGPDMTLVYPESSVTLNANTSTDDKGITYYLWQLTSEDHLDQAVLVNPSLPIVLVLNLTPGMYTFTLTVADSALQMSTDTVQVSVLKGQQVTPPGIATGTMSTSGKQVTSPGIATDVHRTSTSPGIATDVHRTMSTSTSESKDPALPASPTNNLTNTSAQLQGEDLELQHKIYSKQSNLLKVVVPVLLCLAAIFMLSAVIVCVAFRLVRRNKRRMKYQYKRLPGTLEKT